MGERRFIIQEAVRQPAMKPATLAARPRQSAEVSAERRAQVQAVLGSALSRREKQAALDAWLAGASINIDSLPKHAAMPGVAIGAGAARAHAASAVRPGRQPRMPGIAVGGPTLRAHTGHQRLAAGEQPRMPGIPVGPASH